MRVLFQSRSTLFSVPGGDTIQVLKTAEALRRRDCEVDISLEAEPDLRHYDLVHLFNFMRPQDVYLQAANARKWGRKVVISPIYLSFAEYDQKARGGWPGRFATLLGPPVMEYAKVLGRAISNGEAHKGTRRLLLRGFGSLQNELANLADVFLPNSPSEWRQLTSDFPRAGRKHHVVVPNGVDAKLFAPSLEQVPEDLLHLENAVLCVARIEGLKNQLNLVRAMKGLTTPLVLIGQSAPNHTAYFEKIRAEANDKLHLVGPVPHELLPPYYRVCKVHALVSWMETTGLSSLEAGASGCNLVITDRGFTRDYFGSYGFYCEPDSVESIRTIITRALESPVNQQLRTYILENFTWEKAADKTLEGYQFSLESAPHSRPESEFATPS